MSELRKKIIEAVTNLKEDEVTVDNSNLNNNEYLQQKVTEISNKLYEIHKEVVNLAYQYNVEKFHNAANEISKALNILISRQ